MDAGGDGCRVLQHGAGVVALRPPTPAVFPPRGLGCVAGLHRCRSADCGLADPADGPAAGRRAFALAAARTRGSGAVRCAAEALRAPVRHSVPVRRVDAPAVRARPAERPRQPRSAAERRGRGQLPLLDADVRHTGGVRWPDCGAVCRQPLRGFSRASAHPGRVRDLHQHHGHAAICSGRDASAEQNAACRHHWGVCGCNRARDPHSTLWYRRGCDGQAVR